jgi:hypothetical protein
MWRGARSRANLYYKELVRGRSPALVVARSARGKRALVRASAI